VDQGRGTARQRTTRLRSVALGTALLGAAVLAAGCDDEPAGAAEKNPPPPAASAGGLCQLLDYGVIKTTLGIEFGVAAAAEQGQTQTCVVQPADESYPDLLLTQTATLIEPAVFTSTVTPKGAATVPGLGKVAYSAQVPVAGDSGPGAEVAWLSAKRQAVMMLRLRVRPDAAQTLTESSPKLVALARLLETG
jgi:hypothetical protein